MRGSDLGNAFANAWLASIVIAGAAMLLIGGCCGGVIVWAIL